MCYVYGTEVYSLGFFLLFFAVAGTKEANYSVRQITFLCCFAKNISFFKNLLIKLIQILTFSNVQNISAAYVSSFCLLNLQNETGWIIWHVIKPIVSKLFKFDGRISDEENESHTPAARIL